MANQRSPSNESNLDPTATSFVMPAENASSSTAPTTPATGAPNGQAKGPKQKHPEPRSNVTAEDAPESSLGAQLTPAQLKKQKAAEKAARRAGKVAERGAQAQSAPPPPGQQQGPVQSRETQDRQRRASTANREGGMTPAEGQHRRTTSTTARLPVRGAQPAGLSQQQQSQQPGDRTASPREKVIDKRVPMLSHLYPSLSTRRASLTTADRQIHPAVLTLGLQLRDYVICGSNARTVATLLVFKKVIQSYDTPSGVALSRDLTRYLSHQINFLSQARQLSTAQGNSIRWIKKLISALDPDLADTEAKTFLCKAIDTFIREKVTLADEVIASQAISRMEDQGEVILTYGKSSVVEKTLLSAWEEGKRFKVIVADSRPLFEGKNLCRSLIRNGLTDVQYCLLNGIADVIEREGVTKCFMGASAMLGNGNLRSRAGSAMVAMMAKEGVGSARGRGAVPVIVLCETVKFTAKAALDSVAMNEVADADVLIERADPDTLIDSSPQQSQQQTKQDSQTKKGGGSGGGKSGPADDGADEQDKKGLDGWRDQPNLYLVNLMYDVTPSEYLDLVICELGSLPPGAVPVVNGVHGGDE